MREAPVHNIGAYCKKGDRILNLEYVLPEKIEERSFEIIASELGDIDIPEENLPVLMRVIHTTADFDYVKNLKFSDGAVKKALEVLQSGAVIVTDTNMALAGINKPALKKLGCEAVCFMADLRAAEKAKAEGTTRAAASVDIASEIKKPVIYAVGNAPTALVRLRELIDSGKFRPELIIAMPVGFVNVVQSKELIMESDVPYIAAAGRKGGSNAAAAVCNALMYMITRK